MQVIRHRFGIMSALLCSIVLAGCSDREVILPGKREPILTSEASATDGAGALAAPKAFAMPTRSASALRAQLGESLNSASFLPYRL